MRAQHNELSEQPLADALPGTFLDNGRVWTFFQLLFATGRPGRRVTRKLSHNDYHQLVLLISRESNEAARLFLFLK